MRLLWPFVVVTLVAIGTQAEKFKCEISGDPHLVTFGNQKASFPWPCVFHVTRLNRTWESSSGPVTGYQSIRLDIYAASDMETYKDRYFVSYVKVEIRRFITRSRSEYSALTLDASQSHLKQPNVTPPKWRKYGSITDYEIRSQIMYGYDSTNNLYYLSVMGSLRITFRPVNRSQGIPQASGRPGLFIEFTKGQFSSTVKFPVTVCSTPTDRRSFQELAEMEGFTSSEDVMLYRNLKNPAIVKQFEQKCTDALTAFQTCSSPPEEVFKSTINRFAELFASPSEEKRCLEKHQNILDVFILAIRGNFCANSTAKEEMDKLFEECNAM